MQFALLFVSLTDPVPTDNQVKAGPAAAIVFILLMVAVGVLAFSLRHQFKKVAAAKQAGVYGEEEARDEVGPADGEGGHEAGHATGGSQDAGATVD